MRTLLVLAGLVALVYGDTYMHNPRGSNNRLNEKRATRQNANRLFDSQNNNRGGYNVGDRDDTPSGAAVQKQYRMKYFMSHPTAGKTYLDVEWTAQHGCGGNEDDDPHKVNCNMVIQFMCRNGGVTEDEKADVKLAIRDGTSTDTINHQASNNENESKNSFTNRRDGQNTRTRGLHESFEWYDKCKNRERNKGLFTADQNVRNNKGSTATRQNNNGNRRGYECPEERDYYPYWHPTEWKDIAILAENATMCDYYKKHNFNKNTKWECVQNFPGNDGPRHWSKHNNKAACEAAGGTWTEFHNYLEVDTTKTSKVACEAAGNIWGKRIFNPVDACLVPLPEVDCRASEWSRVNHLGNGREAEPLTYRWTIPHFPSGENQKCVLRLRYNISTDDYDPWHTDYKSNQNNAAGIQSPVTQNPTIEVGANNIPIKLAINTAQFGRTFQDRSHMFILRKRPNDPDTNAPVTATIHNLNVRGKRGNIVQTFPAVEYDFIPTNLEMEPDDLVHVQWTGSNTHDNNPPAGDGQAGDAGEGTGGTDRHNLCETPNRNANYPTPLDSPLSKMFTGAKVKWMAQTCKAAKDMTEEDIKIQLCSGGYFSSKDDCQGNGLDSGKAAINNLLNNNPASYEGMLLKMSNGCHHYLCTRNNNFTNRSQKGTICVGEKFKPGNA